jgi:ribose transport system ATP-binding protein
MNSDGILLKIEGVCKTYAVPVLTDISLEIKRGEIHSIVGENGAGKALCVHNRRSCKNLIPGL